MTKWSILPFFLFLISGTVAQTNESLSVHNAAESLLSREITFSHGATSLENVLNQLEEENLKISYSPDRVKEVTVPAGRYDSVSVSSLLASLLKNTGFTYVLVGRIIVIVEKAPEVSSSGVSADSSKVSQSTDSSAPTANTSKLSVSKRHVYSHDLNLSYLPAKERRKIHKLYRQELKWATLYRRSVEKRLGMDSLSKSEPRIKYRPVSSYDYYGSASLGLLKYVPLIEENTTFTGNAVYELDASSSVYPKIGFGLVSRFTMLGSGIAYQKLKTSGYWAEYQKKVVQGGGGNGNGNGNGGGGIRTEIDTIPHRFTEEFSIISVPLELTLYKQTKSIFAGIGPKIQVNFISLSQVELNKFEQYYQLNEPEETYSEENNKVAASVGLKAQGGIILENKMLLSACVEYNRFVTSFSENSLFKFNPNSLVFQVSFTYLLDKAEIRRVKRLLKNI